MDNNKGTDQVCKFPMQLFPHRASGAQKTGTCQQDKKNHPGYFSADHSWLFSGKDSVEQGCYGKKDSVVFMGSQQCRKKRAFLYGCSSAKGGQDAEQQEKDRGK